MTSIDNETVNQALSGHRDLGQKMAERPCFGTFLKLPRPEVVDILALAGFDFVICDMEHAQVSEMEARTVLKACFSIKLPVVVRLPEPTPGVVNRLMEGGALGIQMPRLRNRTDTQNLYSIMNYPPKGRRSVGNANMWAGYGVIPVPQYLDDSNARALVIGQFETREIDESIDEMMQGLDVAFIGPMDLSVDFGYPGQFDHPEVAARVREIEAAAKRTGTFMGAFVGTVERATRLASEGYRYLAISGDVGMLVNGARNLVKSLHEATGG